MILDQPYSRDSFVLFINAFLPGFRKDIRKINFNFKNLKSATYLGESVDLETQIIEVETNTDIHKKQIITVEAFSLLKSISSYRTIVIFHNGHLDQWRMSLMYSLPEIENGKVIVKLSNPKRFSYVLGVKSKINTPYKFLIKQGVVRNFDDLKNRFSIEVVNREFYSAVAESFTQLVGGQRKKGSQIVSYPGMLSINGQINQSMEHQEFAVRLIGRIVFSWFLKEKKSKNNISLVPNNFVSSASITQNYYHSVLEIFFFELLNTHPKKRKDIFKGNPYNLIPYLNGGLFNPQDGENGDFYTFDESKNTGCTSHLSIPDHWFMDFYILLESYNFTVDENTSHDVELSIDPEMLGRIFENLLAEINPETGESARKSTGSFYTPRAIVEYMVDRSLLYYLHNKTKIETAKISSLISYESIIIDVSLSENETDLLVDALSTLKVLDPACGSGAFPIGILQKIVYVLQRIDPNSKRWFEKQLKLMNPEIIKHIEKQFSLGNFDYVRKLGVIRDSIYGVDIQPIATEISRLRCFLTLIVEENVEDDIENRGIQTLPNLDFKFVAANSLVGLPERKNKDFGVIELFEDTSYIEKLKQVRDMYFEATSDARTELQAEFKRYQSQMVMKDKNEYQGTASDLHSILSKWEPFKHKAVIWFNPEWMFGVHQFDIVIANPPYIGEKGHKDIFADIKQDGLKKFYLGKMDLYYFFFHLSINLVKDEGLVTFITTNYYPTANGALKLRKDFYERTSIRELINFNELKIFESALGQHNMVTILEKGKRKINTLVETFFGDELFSGDELSFVLNNPSNKKVSKLFSEDDLFDGPNKYLRLVEGFDESPHLDRILNKIQNGNQILGNFANVNQGIVSGADKVTRKHIEKYKWKYQKGAGIFVVNEKEVIEDKLEKIFLKPWFKNSDISKYHTSNITTEFILYVHGKIDMNSKAFIHLKKFYDNLNERKESNNAASKWYELWRAREQDIFEAEKIVAPQRSYVNTFGYNSGDWYASADVYFITKRDMSVNFKYLLAILNSKLYYVWLYNRGKRKGEMLELYQQPLSEIPVRFTDKSLEKQVVEIVEKILSSKKYDHIVDTTEYESELDELVYRIYKLNSDEVNYVEEFYNEKTCPKK